MISVHFASAVVMTSWLANVAMVNLVKRALQDVVQNVAAAILTLISVALDPFALTAILRTIGFQARSCITRRAFGYRVRIVLWNVVNAIPVGYSVVCRINVISAIQMILQRQLARVSVTILSACRAAASPATIVIRH